MSDAKAKFHRWLRKMQRSQYDGGENAGWGEKLVYNLAGFLFFVIFGIVGFCVCCAIYLLFLAGVMYVGAFLFRTAYDWLGTVPMVAGGLLFLALLAFMFMADHKEQE